MNTKNRIHYGFAPDLYEPITVAAQPKAWSSPILWSIWYAKTCKKLNRVFPKFKTSKASNIFWEITKADLALLREFQSRCDWREDTQKLFELEDSNSDFIANKSKTVEDARFGSSYARYNAKAPFALANELNKNELIELFQQGYRRSSKNIFSIKQLFQRPRPAYAQFCVNPKQRLVRQLITQTAQTPSFIAGHTAQALLSTIHVLLNKPGEYASAKDTDEFLSWANDVGDRRIWAGLHYPLDSVGSWVFVARLLPHVYDKAEAGQAIDHFERALALSKLRDYISKSELNHKLDLVDEAIYYAKRVIAKS